MSEADRRDVITELSDALEMIRKGMAPELIPEVGSNIVYALAGATEPGEVAGIEGRIVRLRDAIHPVGDVVFGASDHVARIVLTVMKFDPAIRSAANIRFSDEYIRQLDGMMLEICEFDRLKEPKGVKTMDWGVASCCREAIPDVIFDRGGIGKEPMIRILGEDPVAVAHNILKLSRRIKNTKF